jgi:hypothetical protein
VSYCGLETSTSRTPTPRRAVIINICLRVNTYVHTLLRTTDDMYTNIDHTTEKYCNLFEAPTAATLSTGKILPHFKKHVIHKKVQVKQMYSYFVTVDKMFFFTL